MNARLLVLCIWLVGCAASGPGSGQEPEAGVRVAHEDGTVSFGSARYRPVSPDELGIAAAPTIWQAMSTFGGPPESMEGRQSLEFSIREEGGAMVAVVTTHGLLDDSISATEVRAEFQYGGGQWTPTQAYTRHQCARGPGSGWTTEPCL